LFRTDHDHDSVKVGPIRLVLGAVFIFLGLFLMPALFGRPPQSRIWDRLIVAMLPPDVGNLKAAPSGPSAANGGGLLPRKATSTDPRVAVTEERSVHGVAWGLSYEAAGERAKAEGKPILIDFTGVFCVNCRQMEESVMPRPEVVPLLEQFVTVQLFTD